MAEDTKGLGKGLKALIRETGEGGSDDPRKSELITRMEKWKSQGFIVSKLESVQADRRGRGRLH